MSGEVGGKQCLNGHELPSWRVSGKRASYGYRESYEYEEGYVYMGFRFRMTVRCEVLRVVQLVWGER